MTDMNSIAEGVDLVRLPSGRTLNLRRPRSEGPLDEEELAYCRAHDVELAYDPVQTGWVVLSSEDDLHVRTDKRSASVRVSGKPDGGSITHGRFADLARRYKLRPWHSSEVRTFISLLDNPTIWEYLPEEYPAPLTQDIARDLIEISNQGGHHEVLAVELDGEIVGQVRLAFDARTPEPVEAEISYWLGERYWGRGIASDLVMLFTHLSFQKRSSLTSIFARVHEANAASARVLQKSLYRFESKPSDSVMRIFRVSRTEFNNLTR
jgi:RimJ/RimL family protein N-acetyltransferase